MCEDNEKKKSWATSNIFNHTEYIQLWKLIQQTLARGPSLILLLERQLPLHMHYSQDPPDHYISALVSMRNHKRAFVNTESKALCMKTLNQLIWGRNWDSSFKMLS